ncbi:hypothetical protein KIW84_056095 [Lathyrus oleraceus]|uniref:Retroviral polymerase SH3-like domain-containing protein n=1 Tax=Pisum sativum TaxID=3888 RepID=A0A9D4WZL3_PEA|nr:hypothetical protein KIW84_056095 [Pisum sativum]
MLLSHEVKLEKTKKNVLGEPIFVNVAQAASTASSSFIQEYIFLGYSSSHKGFKCLDPSGRIYISKDDVFNEIKFPYPLLHSQPSIPFKHPSATTIESFHILPTTSSNTTPGHDLNFTSHSAHSDHFSSNTFSSPIQTPNDSQTMSVYPSTSSSNNISQSSFGSTPNIPNSTLPVSPNSNDISNVSSPSTYHASSSNSQSPPNLPPLNPLTAHVMTTRR